MPLEVKLWKIDADRLQPVPRSRLDLEGRLEDWLYRDIGLLSDDLLVIGRQIERYGVPLDLLAVDRDGNLVVVELKRDRTPRDVVAQALDYASWVQELGREEVERMMDDLPGPSFDEAFRKAFGEEPPDVINERHRIYIVASSLDGTTQRIVEYLSSTYGVDINAATFAFFKTEDGEFVARSLLLDEDDVERRATRRSGSKRQPARSEDELRVLAQEAGVADLPLAGLAPSRGSRRAGQPCGSRSSWRSATPPSSRCSPRQARARRGWRWRWSWSASCEPLAFPRTSSSRSAARVRKSILGRGTLRTSASISMSSS